MTKNYKKDFHYSAMTQEKYHHLIISPDDDIAPFQDAIKSATKTLDIKMFQFTELRLIQEVIAAHQRGVVVRVMLNPSRFTGERDNDEAFSLFRKANVPVEATNPKFPITHEKSMVIDGRVAFIMSMNWAPKYFGATRDYGLVTTDPKEVDEVAACFDADWKRMNFTPPEKSRLVWSVGNSRDEVITFIHSAKKSLYIQHEKYIDVPIIEAIAEAKVKRQVDIHAMARARGWLIHDEEPHGKPIHDIAGVPPGKQLMVGLERAVM